MIGLVLQLGLVVLVAALIAARVEAVRRDLDDQAQRHRHRADWQTIRRDPTYSPRHRLPT